MRILTLTIALLSVLAGSALGQNEQHLSSEAVLAAPPKITFTDWAPIADLPNGTEYSVSFPSPVQTGFPANDVVPLKMFLPLDRNGPVPVVLIAHYWGATDLKAESALAANLNQRGIAAAILTLPYHMERTPPGARSGEMAVRPDPYLLGLMMYQSEQDARRAFDFFDQRPEFIHGSYGMVGISLGSLVASLTFAVDPRISAATFALGGANLAHIIWTSSRVANQRDLLRRKGFTEEKLRDALNAVEPLSYLPRSAPAKTFVIQGKFDTVMPPLSTRELIQHLQDPQVLEIQTGHYGGILIQAKILRTVSEFFSQTYQGKSYASPSRLSGVTLRIGGIAAYPQGVDLGVGVDILHLGRNEERFGAVFLTPRGPRLFLGQSIPGGFALGILGSTKGIGAGLMWSIVL